MTIVRAKKSLGQHFLKDDNIAAKITRYLTISSNPKEAKYTKVLEVGPGMGILTKHLLLIEQIELYVSEIDKESIEYLKKNYPNLSNSIIEGDFLALDLKTRFESPLAVIGNFPYNISSQILFKVIENRDFIPEMLGMFQKEVAMRIKASPRSKEYGILSILTQAFYDCSYLFSVNETVFIPPPKVKSGVIKLTRKINYKLNCNESLFFRVVKTGFNQRRKTLKNALSSLSLNSDINSHPYFSKRAEELTIEDFVALTNMVEKNMQG